MITPLRRPDFAATRWIRSGRAPVTQVDASTPLPLVSLPASGLPMRSDFPLNRINDQQELQLPRSTLSVQGPSILGHILRIRYGLAGS